ncbi:hypothetical protein O3G_MSEX008797 [Manduca sexta]|uniref:Uncharacterized protein n=2 Tax=Manduca sexta TaxID=7130 RepID=A0A921ZC17_MANSE|nr:hypothetical protein O3G_MSEX008797 [Manduca sexta]
MYSPIILLFVIKIHTNLANYLEAEANFLKPKLERNNIVNKGVWMKNKLRDSTFEKPTAGDFIFRPNSADVDNILQNNFDAFGENFLQDAPFLSSYVERAKRAVNHIRKRHPRKSMKKCRNKKNCKNNLSDDSDIKNSLISDPKPTSVFNDYPYEVAILLNSKLKTGNKSKNYIISSKNETSNKTMTIKNIDDVVKIAEEKLKLDLNETKNNTSNPKRNTKFDYETEDYKNFVILDDYNKTRTIESDKQRSIFDKDDKAWHQNVPLTGIDNMYKVIPKQKQTKPINERGLIKVISMLTKTFKKIMKQHNEIKAIHEQLQSINDDFLKNIVTVTNKFQDFDNKYNYLIKSNENLKIIEQNLLEREERFKIRQKEMMNNLIEFENQQKKFLMQQKQFYSVQKFMLGQNEKINIKQNLIAKTQSEISHRQNNFARILKKAKQIVDIKMGSQKVSTNVKYNYSNVVDQVTHTTTIPDVTESVKINLFAIPTTNKIENQDDMIIKEKDDQAIDDLVYKFYFNNTFIDNVMRNKIFNTFTPQSREVGINMKNKRDEMTTLLIPVKKVNLTSISPLKRNKRWISRRMRNTKRKNHIKSGVKDTVKKQEIKKNTQNTINEDKIKIDPFLTMAMSFCNQIGQNGNQQILGWCVEKALRRLRYMDTKMFEIPPNIIVNKEKEVNMNKTEEAKIQLNIVTETTVPTTLKMDQTSQVPPKTHVTKDIQNAMFFPGKFSVIIFNTFSCPYKIKISGRGMKLYKHLVGTI